MFFPRIDQEFLECTAEEWGFWKKPFRQKFSEAAYSILHLLPEKEQWEIYQKPVYESGKVSKEIGYWLFVPSWSSSVDESKVS